MLSGGWALRLRLQRTVLGRGLLFAVWRHPEGLKSSVLWAGERCAISRGAECHSRGKPGGGLGPQNKQGTIFGEGKRRKGRPSIGIYFPHMYGISEGGGSLVQATDGKVPLAQAMGDRSPPVWASCGQAPLAWARAVGG